MGDPTLFSSHYFSWVNILTIEFSYSNGSFPADDGSGVSDSDGYI